MRYVSTKILSLGSCAFRQWRAVSSHCKYIHGYRLQAKVWLTAQTLDERNWVFDFGGFKGIKNDLENFFDHKTCVAGDDPEIETFKMLHQKGIIDLHIMKDGVGIEKTAEFVFNHINNSVTTLTDNRVKVVKVEVWEHEGNSAIYEVSENCTKGEVEENVEQTKPDPVEVENNSAVPPNKVRQTGNPFHNMFEGTSWG